MSGIDEGDNMSEQSFPWKTERYFSSFEEADQLRKSLLLKDKNSILQVKVKRCGLNGTQFVVKSRQNPIVLAELEEIERKMNKKSKK